ncbi:MAG: serine/threonine-protein kinase [Gemmataceae bacterium]
MSASAKELTPNLDAEKLRPALERRGLITREEYVQFRAQEGEAWSDLGVEAVLDRFVKAGLLTAGQGRRVASELSSIVNQPIPGYQLLQELGRGSMGRVYKARQVSMDRLVAIKFLHPKLAANQEYIERFFREAHLAAKFSSNNVVQAIDVGVAGTLHYFVMEYVEGTTIKDELEKGKVYEEKEAVEIVLQIAQALDHAHRRNLIHRDIKPANIVLTREGVAKLADLGLARATTDEAAAKAEKGLTIGTPYYIAPEQIRSRIDVDSRADIYSLGATLYHMVTGRPPFDFADRRDVLKAHRAQELVPPDHINTKLSAGLGEVCEFMMAKDRDMRYPSPEGLILDLECLLRDEPPRIARQKIDLAMLQGLQHGVDDDEDAAEEKADSEEMVPIWWFYAALGGLGLSFLINLFLAVK